MDKKEIVAEWLEKPHDEESVLIIRTSRIGSEEMYLFKDELKRCGVNNLMIFLGAQGEIRFVSEQEINEHGWYKRTEDEKNDG